MSKGGKMFDAIMITIIIIASLNYADYIKVDTKLMMVLLAIALYVTAKQTQKSNQKIQKSQKVEPLDGSAVAFDKDAFVNLNAIVNELVKKDSVTIPGNLVVLGKTTFKDDVSINDGKGMLFLNKAYARFGEGAANRRDQYDGEIAYGRHGEALCIVGSGKERNIFTWGHLTSKEGGTLNCTYLKCDDLSANNNITAGTDDANMIRIRQNRVGTKGCGEMEFRSDGWIRHFTYGSGNYRANCGFAASTLYSRDHIRTEGTLQVDKGTELKGTLTAHGQVTCNNTAVGALSVNGRVSCGDLYTNIVDTDVIRGHAWRNEFQNAIRVEKNFIFRNDSGMFLGLSGYNDDNHTRSSNHGHNANHFLWCNYHDISKIGDSRWRTSWSKHHGGIEN